MKKTLILVLCVHVSLCILAQQNLGIRNSNYVGIQGSLLNPSSIADSKLKWDVNVMSVGEVFDNTFLYAPKSSLNFFGIKKIIKGSIDEDLFYTHFDAQNPGKLYHVTLSTEILGPSFCLKIKKNHWIGLTIAGRAYADIRNISGGLAQNAFDYFQNKGLWNTDLHDNKTKINSMGWLQYGIHYATVIYSRGRDELKAGISLNYLQGIAAAYVKNTNINYKIVDSANFIFSNSSVDYGRTDFNEDRKLNDGHGFGGDIGLTYVHLDPGKNNYIYRIGLSVIDIGAINFNRNASSYHLQADSANVANWHQLKFSNNTQLDQTLSAVFYNGDSARSLNANHFKMGLPAAISVQADWDVYKNYFLNATVIKGFGHGSGQGVTRPDVYSVTPRYETKWLEVSVPVSLLYYGHWQSRIGLAVRAGYFFIGGDAPGALLKLNNLEGVDFYTGVHFFIAEKQKTTRSGL
jgi:uncharacterized protein DUF5723